MWNRAGLKSRAKIVFKRNYWKCVLISFILLLFSGGVANVGRSSGSTGDIVFDYVDNDIDFDIDFDMDLDLEDHIISSIRGGSAASWIIGTIVAILLSGIMLVLLLLNIFIFQPLEIGGCRFFIENAYEMPGVGKILFAFKSGYYGEMVLTLFLRRLFTFLWSLLLIVPGIIKSYEYRMIPYLLADCPEMSREDAFRISKEMMRGQKMEAFILDLSFIGWHLLSAITCGIVEIFYVAPYVHATNAELFLTLREQYFQRCNPQ